MDFDYSTSGLPDNARWKIATQICHQWLSQHMTMFGPERIINFMHNQPVAAARRITDNCADWSEESVTLLLLGPAKDTLIANDEVEQVSRHIFGDRAVDLLRAMVGEAEPDAEMVRDMNRIFLVEGVSTMSDQMIGRARIDKHHQTRWDILNNLEQNFAKIKGQDPALDVVFEDAMAQSKAALTALDKGATVKKGFKPPQP